MNSILTYPYPERILSALLLEEIYQWQDTYREKLKTKYPYLSEEKIRDKILTAEARKFREKHNKILYIKLKKLKESF